MVAFYSMNGSFAHTPLLMSLSLKQLNITWKCCQCNTTFEARDKHVITLVKNTMLTFNTTDITNLLGVLA